jgi:sulfide:quinone oxidoreductase
LKDKNMQLKPITLNLSITGQITVADLPALVNLGIKSIICNRPDGESADQPTFAQIAEAAKSIGIEARYLPVVPGKATQATATQFAAALSELSGPIVAYCRSGARSEAMWEMSQ